MDPVETIKVGNRLGESVLWDGETQSLWWTDIEARRLYRWNWMQRAVREFATPERLGSFGLVRDSDQLIAAFESGFALFNPHAGNVTWLERPYAGRKGLRMNDGRVDRLGRFWAGGMAETSEEAGGGSLYCIDGSGRAEPRETGITISNSIAWSPDGSVFYFADSPRRTIWRYASDPVSGAISDRRVFVTTPEGAFPDGATVDKDGYLWSAHWGAGRIVRYAPDSSVERSLDLPVSQPTCVAFGGPRLDHLFVTSAREGLDEDTLRRQPDAGDLLVYNVGIEGLPEDRYLIGARRSMPGGGRR